MQVIDVKTGKALAAVISPLGADRRGLIRRRYHFDWSAAREPTVYKLTLKGSEEILGLVSVALVPQEERIAIRLLAVAAEQVGQDKTIDHIAGALLAYVARLAVRQYGANAAISLVPKTALRKHYMDRYGFEPAGSSLFIAGVDLYHLIEKYEDHEG